MIRNPRDLVRYQPGERVNHWLVGMLFILLALSGLAFFHPAFYPLTALFGGGEWARILHPYLGVAMAYLFLLLAIKFWRLNVITAADKEWLSRVREMLDGNDHNMPAAGKYNGGQKRLFWLLVGCVVLMVISGLCIWRAQFSPPIELARLGAVVHAAVGAIMIGLVIVHIYAAIWTKGTIRAMWYGTVTRAWAKQHHRSWYQEMSGKQ